MEDQFTQRAGSNLLDKSLELVEELILILLNLPANNREQYHLLNTYAVATFFALAKLAPDFLDTLLYTPEELYIINY